MLVSPLLRRPLPLAFLGAAASAVVASPAFANAGYDTTALVEAVTLEAVRAHQQEFQAFADASGGNRETSSDGYIDSVLYISRLMTDAGYDVDLQIFPYIYFENLSPAALAQTSPESVEYTVDDPEGFVSSTYSGSGDVTAVVTPVDLVLPPAAAANTSTSGCEAEDFADFPEGDIALVQRGNCAFGLKARNAQEAGAAGVIIFNEGQEGRLEAIGATLGEPGFTIPVVFASFAIGEALAAGGVQARLVVDSVTESRISANVIADSRVGRADRTRVIGAHLDSVPEGPGINDNGSGSAGILEVALQVAALVEAEEMRVDNRLRFAWWGAEEVGLLGSEYYVDNLTEEELAEIELNLNFDMIGSPNYVRFIYDGDGSATEPAGPEGSAFIEWLFRDWFDSQGLASKPTQFSGRSDYGPFIEVGIPAGGLFTGAEGIKTEEEAEIYGGEAGIAYDPCYHEACDTFENNSDQGLSEMLDAVANAVGVFARGSLPVSREKRDGARQASAEVETDYRGNLLAR